MIHSPASPDPPASVWTAAVEPWPATQPLEGDHRADVVVVGAGYTGLSAALHLAERGTDRQPVWRPQPRVRLAESRGLQRSVDATRVAIRPPGPINRHPQQVRVTAPAIIRIGRRVTTDDPAESARLLLPASVCTVRFPLRIRLLPIRVAPSITGLRRRPAIHDRFFIRGRDRTFRAVEPTVSCGQRSA